MNEAPLGAGQRRSSRVTAIRPLVGQLESLLGADRVFTGDAQAYTTDDSEASGVVGAPDAVVLPATADEVARVVSWCYAHEVPLVPRGGGSGLAGGAVPVSGGVVLSLERLTAVRAFDPLLWRIQV